MTIRRTLLILGVLAVGLGYITYSRAQSDADTQLVLPVAEVHSGVTSVTASGSLQADQVANLSFLIAGQVTEIVVTEGEVVTAGQALIRLDGRQQYLAYQQANLSYGLAQVQYQDLRTVDDSDIRIAQANVASAQSAYAAVANAVTADDIAAAELRYQQAQEALQGAQDARRMANPSLIGDTGVSLLDAQIGEASFNAEIARLHLEDLRTASQPELGAAGARISQTQAQLEQVQAGASDYQLEQAQVSIDQAAVSLDQAEVIYDRTILTAPFDGVIASVNVEVGQRVAANTVALQLVDIEPLTLRGEVDEADIRLVQIGTAAQVSVDALPGMTFPGAVSRIAPESRNSGGVIVYDVDIQLNTSDARLRPGMSADATLTVPQ